MKTFTEYLIESKRSATFEKSLKANKQLAYLAIQIKMHRHELGLNQTDLAKMAGVTQQQLSLIELGVNSETETLLKVCDALGADLVLVVNNVKRENTGGTDVNI